MQTLSVDERHRVEDRNAVDVEGADLGWGAADERTTEVGRYAVNERRLVVEQYPVGECQALVRPSLVAEECHMTKPCLVRGSRFLQHSSAFWPGSLLALRLHPLSHASCALWHHVYQC